MGQLEVKLNQDAQWYNVDRVTRCEQAIERLCDLVGRETRLGVMHPEIELIRQYIRRDF